MAHALKAKIYKTHIEGFMDTFTSQLLIPVVAKCAVYVYSFILSNNHQLIGSMYIDDHVMSM